MAFNTILWGAGIVLGILPQLNLGLLSDYKICGDPECESKFKTARISFWFMIYIHFICNYVCFQSFLCDDNCSVFIYTFNPSIHSYLFAIVCVYRLDEQSAGRQGPPWWGLPFPELQTWKHHFGLPQTDREEGRPLGRQCEWYLHLVLCLSLFKRECNEPKTIPRLRFLVKEISLDYNTDSLGSQHWLAESW